jgi:hypothetical protein
MGVFYKSQPEPTDSVLEPIVLEALAMDKIADAGQRSQQAGQLLTRVGRRKGVSHPDPEWWRVGIAVVLAGVVFGIAISLENSPEHAESSKTLLRVFEILFTAILALLGIETAKKTG